VLLCHPLKFFQGQLVATLLCTAIGFNVLMLTICILALQCFQVVTSLSLITMRQESWTKRPSKRVKSLPNIPRAVNNFLGGRTYPLEGTFMLLPQHYPYTEAFTVIICGGSTPSPGIALDNCVPLQPEVAGAQWTIERMVSPSRSITHVLLTRVLAF